MLNDSLSYPGISQYRSVAERQMRGQNCAVF